MAINAAFRQSRFSLARPVPPRCRFKVLEKGHQAEGRWVTGTEANSDARALHASQNRANIPGGTAENTVMASAAVAVVAAPAITSIMAVVTGRK